MTSFLLPWTVMFVPLRTVFNWIRLASSSATMKLSLSDRNHCSCMNKHKKIFMPDVQEKRWFCFSVLSLHISYTLVPHFPSCHWGPLWSPNDRSKPHQKFGFEWFQYDWLNILTWINSGSHWICFLWGSTETTGHFKICLRGLPLKRFVLFFKFRIRTWYPC